jgi:hypothetical protein
VDGVDVILTALTAGAAAGTGEVAKSAVVAAYQGLRDALRRVLSGRARSEQALEAEETDPGVWRARLGAELGDSGADRDEEVLAAARDLLALVDPDGTRAGKYVVDVRGAHGVQVGDGAVTIGTAYGPTAGTMTGPVSVSFGDVPDPPARPEA